MGTLEDLRYGFRALAKHQTLGAAALLSLGLGIGANTTIYTIGLGPKVDHDFLQNIANLSSGESYFPDDVEGLRDDYRRVVENLRRRYVVSYTSTNGARDGSWRRVEIRPRPDDVVVRSRGGYVAPER